jgi:hypothetical protein
MSHKQGRLLCWFEALQSITTPYLGERTKKSHIHTRVHTYFSVSMFRHKIVPGISEKAAAEKVAAEKAAAEKAAAEKAAAERAAAAKRAADEKAAAEKAAAEKAAAEKAAAERRAAAEKAAAERTAAERAAAAKRAADEKAAAEKAAAEKAAAEKAAAERAAAEKAAAERTAAERAATDKAAAEKAAERAAAVGAAEELRRRATALGFLQMLTSLNVAEDATLKTAVVWCDEKGATSVSDIVECDMVDDFVRHLGLKPIPDKKLRTMLQALTTASSSSSSPSPQLEWNPHKPTFYFLPRATVLSATATQLKRMQELRDSKLLEKMAVDLNEAFQGKGLIRNVLFVSHRWEDWATPDETGAQLAALKAHLMDRPEVQYIWFDYSCMPQRSSICPPDKDDRTPAEKAEFDHMLKSIADLYLTAKVLILLDTMYRTRFWTTMEGWCAMQKVTSEGVRPATESESRVTVSCIHNATQHDERALLEMSTKTAQEITKFLASPDVAVTNKKDKETMLPIVGKTDEHVREMMSGMHGRWPLAACR